VTVWKFVVNVCAKLLMIEAYGSLRLMSETSENRGSKIFDLLRFVRQYNVLEVLEQRILL
jgi:hypothetical protein